MKTDFWIVLATTLCPLLTHAQLPLPVKVGQPTIVDIGPHHRVWQTVIVDEQGQTNVSSYTELATGLNHINSATGKWEESKEQFVITPQGHAVATNGQHQVILAGNINSGGSVDLLMPDGQRLLSNPMGLSFFDTASGKNVLIAEVTNCIGEVVAPNVVLYPDAFDTLKCAIRYTYTKAGFEQDIIIYQNPGSPADYGLNPSTTLLELYSEFHDPPAPAIAVQEIENGQADQTLNFGNADGPRSSVFVQSERLGGNSGR